VTEPILGWYERRGILVSVAAERPVEDVTREVLVALKVLSQSSTSYPTATGDRLT